MNRCDKNLRDMEARGEILEEVPSSSFLVSGSELVVPVPEPYVEQSPFPSTPQRDPNDVALEQQIQQEMRAAQECAATLQAFARRVEYDDAAQKSGSELAEKCRAYNQTFVTTIPQLHSSSLLGMHFPPSLSFFFVVPLSSLI